MLGFLNINKPSGMTSNAVVQRVKKRFKLDKIGHFGTLDPMASGVLPLAIGKATRLFEYSLSKKKGYIATFKFGEITDTLDATGSILSSTDTIPSKADILAILPSFIGEQSQMPPQYSAKNVNGRRAYDLAREGIEFELKPKEICIYKFDMIEELGSNEFSFYIECSSGTYIRAIGRDLAEKLGSLATMTSLNRVMAGEFNIDNAIDLDKCLECDNIDKILLAPQDIFKFLGKIDIDAIEYSKLRNGIRLTYGSIPKDSFVTCDGVLVGIAKKDDKILKLDTFLGE